MNHIAGILLFFLMFVGVSVAQHGSHGQSSPHSAPPSVQHNGGYAHPPARGGYPARPDYRRGGYGDWYGHRPEYRGFGWRHYYGWHYRPYAYLGPGYCYTGVWGAPYFSFGFNASRWRVLDFDFGIVNGWYPGSCAYVMTDPYHDGWFLLYDQQTGQYVHVEQY